MRKKERTGRQQAADRKFEGRVKTILAGAMRDPELGKMFDETSRPWQTARSGRRRCS